MTVSGVFYTPDFQSIFQARIQKAQKAHDGSNLNYMLTYDVLVLR